MNNGGKGFPLGKRQVCTACLLLFAALTGGMSVQAVDVSTETAFINAVKGNSETEINVTADINFTKDLGTRKNINLKINGNGYNLNMINSNVKNGLKIQDDTNTFQAEISNLTFKNALVNALTTELKKGVSSSITITNSQFLNNETAKDTGGGAIYNDIAVAAAQTKTINISNTIFSGNISSHETKGRGGAISNKIENVPGIVNININSVFTANEVMDSHSADVGGGAIYNHIVLQDNGQANINMSGQYSDNVTNNAYGGAIYNYINNKDNSSALVNLTIGYDNAPTLFEKNLADEHGGAVYNYINSKNKSAGVVTINIKDNVSFIDNTSYDNGGAVANYVEGKGENITFNIDGYYESNQASNNNGGAVYNYINKDYNSSTLTAFNIKGTYKDNLAEDAGGAVYFENVNNGLLEVNILGGTQFIENTSYERWGGALAFDDTNNTANSLHITSNSSSDGSGDIIFKGNQGNINNIEHGPNDIYVIKDGNETFTIKFDGSDGKVLLEGGIRGRALNGGKVEIEKSNAGTLEFGKDSLNNNFDGDFTQTGGTTIFRGTSFFNGNLVFNNSQGIGSNLNLWQEKSAVTINNLSLNNININTVGDSGSGNFTAFSLPNAVLSGTNNFIIDANALTGESDRFADIANASGIINISSVNFIDLPLTEYVDYQIFSGNDLSGVNFTAADGLGVTTHVARYKFSALSGQKGIYRLAISNFNPQVFRGQAATLAVYQNQLIVNNTLFDHVYLDSNERTAMANKYAAGTDMFAPYQFTKKDGAIWTKTYATFERLSMTHGLNVANNAYGQIIGADFPVVELSKGWKFLPTAYISYNGGHQTFNGVSMYQNGGQGGFMGTFNKGDFIGSVLAYGGGYNNEMSVAGNTENTGNWFAGTAVKGAYNFHLFRNFIIQPNLLASYNIFGKQNWYSNYGALSMNSGLLNGINVAPGLNLIYGRETWSVYLTALYMYNINDSVGGSAGSVNLPSLSMRHGYLEYGVGATKTWKDRLSSYVQFVIRNGGRTGVGFQLGLTWKF